MKMKELREDIGMKKHHKMKVVGSRIRWAGHVQITGKDRLSKIAWKAEEGGRRRRGRPKLEKLCQTRSGKGRYERPRVEDHRKGQREMERVNNESGRSYQVTWTPSKGARGRSYQVTWTPRKIAGEKKNEAAMKTFITPL